MGGAAWPGFTHPINETGSPEVFTSPAGDQYLLPTLGGSITSAQDLGSGLQSVVEAINALRRDIVRQPAVDASPALLAAVRDMHTQLERLNAGTARQAADLRRGAVTYV